MLATPNSRASTPSRRELVVFAPYPPAKNGIADYAAELMPYHAAEFDVTLVIADDAPLPEDTEPRVLLASEFRRHRSCFEDAAKLYHIGNNPDHCYMLDLLASDPGIVVLHDFNLCYLHETATLNLENKRRHFAAMEAEYGALGRDILSWQLENAYRELFTGYELPLNGDVLEHASAIITHSRQIQYKVAARVPRKSVWYVPHHLSPMAAPYFTRSKQTARNLLGLPQNETIVTAVGFVTRAKQIALTLAALSTLRDQVGRFRFVLAGERRPTEYDVDADIAKFGLSGAVTCTDYLDEETFFTHLVAADVVVNLRYPSGGEMSGTLIRALGLGVPTIVFNHGPMGELPNSVVTKIDWSPHTQTALTDALHNLMTNSGVRQKQGANASAYVRRIHAIDRVAKLYSKVLNKTKPDRRTEQPLLKQYFQHPVTTARKLRGLGDRKNALAHALRNHTWWTISGIPLGVEQPHRALVVSPEQSETASLLFELHEWKQEAVTTLSLREFLDDHVRGRDKVPFPSDFFSFALVIAPAQMEEVPAALLMRRLNSAVRHGGNICLETSGPEETEGSNTPLGRTQLQRRLEDAGFGAIRRWLPQEGLIGELLMDKNGTQETEQIVCVTARKVSDYSVWRFSNAPQGIPMRWGGRIGVKHGP